MGKEYLIRTAILNIPLVEWQKIPKGTDCIVGDLDFFIKEFGNNLRFLSVKANNEEREFIELYFKAINK